MTYQGHHPDGSGVQLHSAGSHYPLIVGAQETTPEAGGPCHTVYVQAPDGSRIWARLLTHATTRVDRIESWDQGFRFAERVAKFYR